MAERADHIITKINSSHLDHLLVHPVRRLGSLLTTCPPSVCEFLFVWGAPRDAGGGGKLAALDLAIVLGKSMYWDVAIGDSVKTTYSNYLMKPKSHLIGLWSRREHSRRRRA